MSLVLYFVHWLIAALFVWFIAICVGDCFVWHAKRLLDVYYERKFLFLNKLAATAPDQTERLRHFN